MQQGIRQGIEKGIEKGREEERRLLVCNLLDNGFEVPTIEKVTGLTEKEILAISNSLRT